MKRYLAATALVAAALTPAAASAAGKTKAFKQSGIGATYNPGGSTPTLVIFVRFTDPTFGPGVAVLTASGPANATTLTGKGTEYFAGATIKVTTTYTIGAVNSATMTLPVTGTGKLTGGTGKAKGITGKFTFAAGEQTSNLNFTISLKGTRT